MHRGSGGGHAGGGRGHAGLNHQPAYGARAYGAHDPALTQRLQQLATELDAAGMPLQQFQAEWTARFGTVLRAAEYGGFCLEDLIARCE